MLITVSVSIPKYETLCNVLWPKSTDLLLWCDIGLGRSLRPRLYLSRNRHNTTVLTDSRQGSRTQPHYCLISAATLKPIRLECCVPTTADSLARHLLQLAYDTSIRAVQRTDRTSLREPPFFRGEWLKIQEVPHQRSQAGRWDLMREHASVRVSTAIVTPMNCTVLMSNKDYYTSAKIRLYHYQTSTSFSVRRKSGQTCRIKISHTSQCVVCCVGSGTNVAVPFSLSYVGLYYAHIPFVQRTRRRRWLRHWDHLGFSWT